MFNYLLRRALHAIPVVLGVMAITFVLFYTAQSPEAMARRVLGPKAPAEAVANWLAQRGYDRPMFLALDGGNPFDSQFFRHIGSLARFDLGVSDVTGEPVIARFKAGAVPSLCITLPAFLAGLAAAIGLALLQVSAREGPLDTGVTLLSVVMMSLPIMVYVIFGHALLAVGLKYFPAYGFDLGGWDSARFLALPVLALVIAGLGSDTRLFRAIFLEEIRADYVRTARAKGVSAARVLSRHVLKNGMINIITLTVAALPSLVLGSLVIEDFFGIPGLGGLAMQAIRESDFAVIRATTYVGSLLYLAGLMLTDACYAMVDPRIRLK
jgi:peptide/nickel transport system permease protein